jgi:hypothetical protein
MHERFLLFEAVPSLASSVPGKGAESVLFFNGLRNAEWLLGTFFPALLFPLRLASLGTSPVRTGEDNKSAVILILLREAGEVDRRVSAETEGGSQAVTR